MSAHVYTALQQLQEATHTYFPSLQAALDFSCWTEDLSLEHYRELADIVHEHSEEALQAFVSRCLPVYQEEWRQLGEPRTREDWLRRKYGVE